MKIQEVTIEGYQSHVNSTFSLSPGLTVITGPSDAGKTAIIRALRWFAFNEPTGEAFLHTIRNPDGSIKEAVDQAKVSVTFDNGVTITKTRRKGKTTYTHSDYPTPWEKAEVPPEIKETLGLLKQEYGDFETCLNFAFQLDAPFLLSETASVGAKVLGKLAGTEVVDKSISEVNKKTHQTRTEISYQDKQIGEIDVCLTEYFDLDTHDKQLTAVEEIFKRVQEDKEAFSKLVALMKAYAMSVDQKITYFDKAESLSGVVLCKVQLSQVEHDQSKKEKLEDYNRIFWEAVKAQKEPERVLRLTENLEGCKFLLFNAENLYSTLEKLLLYQNQYEEKQKVIYETSGTIIKLDQGIGLKFLLEEAEQSQTQADELKRLVVAFWDAQEAEREIRGRVSRLEAIKPLQAKYEALEADYERLDTLKRLNAVAISRTLSLSAANKQVEILKGSIETAKAELHEAWEAAGGVCPLCGSEVKEPCSIQ